VKRREILKLAGAALLAGCATPGTARARIVVVGGGFGGATAAKYLRMWHPATEVVLVERAATYDACPISNLVLAGFAAPQEARCGYSAIAAQGVRVIADAVTQVDAARRRVRLARGGELAYDRLVLAPGLDFSYGEIEGYEAAMRAGRVLHAWDAGEQTLALRRQLEQMRPGGVFVISIPPAPFRCPPGPYERASLVAAYLKRANPRAKVLVLDANPDITSKGALFRKAWADLYAGTIEYRPNCLAVGFDAASSTLKLEVEDVRGDVMNVIPPQRAAAIAQQAGVVTHNGRWCDVDWRSMESTAVPGVHLLGDATLAAPAMAKSASMANNHAKLAAAAIIELLAGRAPEPEPRILNTCYSFVSRDEAIHVTSVHAWSGRERTLRIVPGSSGVSAARSAREAVFARAWERTILADSLG